MRALHALSRGAAGSRAISQMLRPSGVDAGRWLARRQMWECGLTSRQPVKHHYRVNEDKSPPLPNLLNRQFNPAAPNKARKELWYWNNSIQRGRSTAIRDSWQWKLLCWQSDYAGGSLNVNGTIMRDTYRTISQCTMWMPFVVMF